MCETGWFDLGSWEWSPFLDRILGFARLEMVIDLLQRSGHQEWKYLLGSWPLNGGRISRNNPVNPTRCQFLWESQLWLNGLYLVAAWMKRFRIHSSSNDTDKNWTKLKTDTNCKPHTVLLTQQTTLENILLKVFLFLCARLHAYSLACITANFPIWLFLRPASFKKWP